MIARVLPPGERKVSRLTVVMTWALMERLSRAAAYAGLSKSEYAQRVIEQGVVEDPVVSDEEIEAAERRQDDWRGRRGLA